MKDDFFKFPSTPHLATLGDFDIRDDKVMSESQRNSFLRNKLTVEEKMDGANLGISFDVYGNIRTQNRGAYFHLPASGQWKKLEKWLDSRTDLFFEILGDQYILFGEWCYARHSVFYSQLSDWFFGFDVYNRKEAQFLSSNRRDLLFNKMQIAQVPAIARGHFTLADLKKLFSQSKFSDQPAEGLYLRLDQAKWLAQRAKLVHPVFIQSVEQHWSSSAIIPNRLSSEIRG